MTDQMEIIPVPPSQQVIDLGKLTQIVKEVKDGLVEPIRVSNIVGAGESRRRRKSETDLRISCR